MKQVYGNIAVMSSGYLQDHDDEQTSLSLQIQKSDFLRRISVRDIHSTRQIRKMVKSSVSSDSLSFLDQSISRQQRKVQQSLDMSVSHISSMLQSSSRLSSQRLLRSLLLLQKKQPRLKLVLRHFSLSQQHSSSHLVSWWLFEREHSRKISENIEPYGSIFFCVRRAPSLHRTRVSERDQLSLWGFSVNISDRVELSIDN